MSAPAIGQRRRWVPGPSAQVDWSDPLAQQLGNLVSGFGCDLAAGPTTRTGVPVRGRTDIGEAFYVTGGASIDTTPHVPYAHNGTAATAYSVHIVFRPVTWPGSFTPIIDGSSGSRDVSVFAGTGGNLSFISIGGGSPGTATTAMAVGGTWGFTITGTAAGVVTYYVNGARVGGSTTTNGTCPAQSFTIGRNGSGGGNNADMHVSMFGAWRRELAPAEVARLHADPFCMLRS